MQFFEKEKSFLQEKYLKAWEHQAVYPHLQISQYMWSQEGSFVFVGL